MRHLPLLFAAIAMVATGGAMAAKKPSKAEVKFAEATKLAQENKPAEAIKLFDELCKDGVKAGCQSSKYTQGIVLFGEKKYGEAAKLFDAICKEGVKEACENATIAAKNQSIVSQTTPEDLEKQRRATAFDAAMVQYKAKQYDQAATNFGALCAEGLDSGCQNQGAVLIEQSDSILKAVKRPNGQDCSTAIIASDFCRKPMTEAIAVLGKVCPTQKTNKALVAACAKRSELERFVAETDKQIGVPKG